MLCEGADICTCALENNVVEYRYVCCLYGQSSVMF